jgi:iron complex outermembrane receptor protein
VDGKIGLNWSVSDDHFVYALISRGHVTGGANIFPPFLPYDEMEVFNYEAGWKADWAEGQVRTQLNGFYQTFDTYQAQFAEVGTGPANIATFRNAAGESDIYGIEFSGQALVGSWGFDFGLAWLESELGTFSGVINPFTLVEEDLTGAESPFAPDLTVNVGVEYTFALGDGMILRPRVDYAHLSETQAGLWDSELLTLESRDLLNVQLRLAPSSGNWYANLWMTNATDEKYAGAIQNNGTLRYAAPPRQYGLRVGVNL